ncbi:DUF3307 domain-containing protein [Metabacillus niabensis]|uniref:DUF3307 domain-containing protein n=1 Tax=Metabacillus niabensis TaxID=324854 RepID=UPI0009D41D3C|nr:Protein of uncharacterised function (DUF3307) [Mycobacteroides abscessus subsp. abscessus]
MAAENNENKSKLDFLYKAIDDAQNTIRFTDTKAGAVIAFWTLVLNVLIRTKDDWINLFGELSSNEKILIIIFIFLMLFYFLRSIWLSYMTLVPKLNPRKHIDINDFHAQDLFFISETHPEIKGKYLYGNYENLKLKNSAKDYHDKISKLDNNDIEKELVFELQKISFIRNIKISRTSTAITSVIYFLITIMLMFIYLFGNSLLDFISIENLGPNISFNLKLFIVLYIGHKIADYILQTDHQAVNKSNSWKALFIHCFIYTVVLTIMGYFFVGFVSWAAIFIIFISHVIIDRRVLITWWAKNIKKMSNTESESVQPTMIELDQAFHYIIIFIVCCL